MSKSTIKTLNCFPAPPASEKASSMKCSETDDRRFVPCQMSEQVAGQSKRENEEKIGGHTPSWLVSIACKEIEEA